MSAEPEERGGPGRDDGPAGGPVLPLLPHDPARLGPFAVVGRLRDEPPAPAAAGDDRRGPDLAPPVTSPEVAAVYAAHGPDGAAVRVVALGAGPAGDAAARDRFGAEVDRLGRDGRLLGASLDGPWPWAATGASDTRTAAALARSPLVPGSVLPGQHAGRGPAFSPHWVGGPRPSPAAAPAAPAATGPRDRRPWVLTAVLGGLLLAALLALAAVACQPRDEASVPAPGQTQQPQPSPRPEASQPAPTPTPSDAPTQDPDLGQPGEDPVPGEEGSPLLLGPGVVGPSFPPGAATELVAPEDLSFAFRVPEGWTCERSAIGPPVVRYDCVSPDGESGGAVQTQPCPQPCGQEAWYALQDLLAPGATWFDVDPTTVAVEDSVPDRDASYRLRMSHLHVAGEREESDLQQLDEHVYAEFWSPADPLSARRAVQAVVNDVRANTP